MIVLRADSWVPETCCAPWTTRSSCVRIGCTFTPPCAARICSWASRDDIFTTTLIELMAGWLGVGRRVPPSRGLPACV